MEIKMNTRKLTVCAVMIALSTVLSMITIYRLPSGGAVTAASMAPVIILSLIFGTKWGVFSAMVYALIQGVTGFYAPPVQNFSSFLIVIVFDYVLAFGVLGLADVFWRIMARKQWAISFAGATVAFLRFLCHLVSGVAIWSAYAPKGQSPIVYSLIYNGSYMLPEIVITAIVLAVLGKAVLKMNKEL